MIGSPLSSAPQLSKWPVKCLPLLLVLNAERALGLWGEHAFGVRSPLMETNGAPLCLGSYVCRVEIMILTSQVSSVRQCV